MPLIPPNRVTAFPLKDDLQWYDPDVVFQPFDDIFGRGVIGTTDLQVVANGTPDGQISVNPGRGYVPYSSGGKRLFRTGVAIRSDAAEFLTAIPAWPGSGNPKVHRIIARIKDATLNAPDVIKGGVFDVLPGTATSGATLVNLSGAQVVPADALLLGNVLQNGSTISTGNIDSTFGTVRARARIGGGNSPAKPIQVNGAALTDRSALNLIAGTGISISAVDNAAADSADVTFATAPELKLLFDYTVASSNTKSTIDSFSDNANTSLSQAYGTLIVRGYLISDTAGPDTQLSVVFNNDATANYDNGMLYYDVVVNTGWLQLAAGLSGGAGQVMMVPMGTGQVAASVFEMQINNYAVASLRKSWISHGISPVKYGTNNPGVTLFHGGGVYHNTTAGINRVALSIAAGTYKIGSRIRIWGM